MGLIERTWNIPEWHSAHRTCVISRSHGGLKALPMNGMTTPADVRFTVYMRNVEPFKTYRTPDRFLNCLFLYICGQARHPKVMNLFLVSLSWQQSLGLIFGKRPNKYELPTYRVLLMSCPNKDLYFTSLAAQNTNLINKHLSTNLIVYAAKSSKMSNPNSS